VKNAFLPKLQNTDTIAALATPPGRGGIGIIRISGALAPIIAQHLTRQLPHPRHASLCHFHNRQGELLDQGIALYFPAPHSFTGEEVIEIQGHGGTVVMDRLLQAVLELGARPARPGEFSERAFLNGKIDLLQAEAIADLIDSGSIQAARSAMRSLQGEFSKKINELVEALTALRSYIEAGIDFPDEEIDLLADGQVLHRLAHLLQQVQQILAQAQQGSLLREGMQIVIIGKPNTGKSSLLNRLTQRETAIVTDIPGTTRDIIRDSVNLDGMPLHITDTAGLRDTTDPVEQEGIRRARLALQDADAVLLLVDDREAEEAQTELPVEVPLQIPHLLLCNKCDLSGQPPGFVTEHSLRLSVKTGAGLELLYDWLKRCAGLQSQAQTESGGALMARRRHLEALKHAHLAIENSLEQARAGYNELLAEELRQAQKALGEITGTVTSDDLLGKIFSEFCIGK